MRASILIPALMAAPLASAHMSIWLESMYGVGADFEYTADQSDPNPVAPLGPNWDSQDEWWFRGPAFRALSPAARGSSAVTELPAGGSVTVELACHVAWTSFGCCEWEATYYNETGTDACPGNVGAYHSGDPNAATVDHSLSSGCALAIADVDNIEDVTMDNLAIFSVNTECIQQKDTTFEIPAMMPACTGEKCICGWFWLANNGTANFYMTAFDCSVTGARADAVAIAAPVDPTWCDPAELGKTCETVKGAKRPLYAYNEPTNVVWKGNNDRPGYHPNWSFSNGAQNDIFIGAVAASSSSKASTSASTSTTKAATTTTAKAAASTTTVKAAVATSAAASASASPNHVVPANPLNMKSAAAAKSSIQAAVSSAASSTKKKTTTSAYKKQTQARVTRTTRTTTAYHKHTEVAKKKNPYEKVTTTISPHQSKLNALKASLISKAKAKHTKRALMDGENLVAERMFEGFEDLEPEME